MQSRAEDAQGVCLLHDAGPAHRMRGDDDKRRETLWKRPTMANEEGFFPLSSSQPYSQKQEAGNRKLTEAREIWLSILIWLGSCSIGGEKGGPGEGGLGGGWRQAEGFVKIVMATFGDFRLFPAKACPLRHAERRAFFVPLLLLLFFFLAVIFCCLRFCGPITSFCLLLLCPLYLPAKLTNFRAVRAVAPRSIVLKSAGAVREFSTLARCT